MRRRRGERESTTETAFDFAQGRLWHGEKQGPLRGEWREIVWAAGKSRFLPLRCARGRNDKVLEGRVGSDRHVLRIRDAGFI